MFRIQRSVWIGAAVLLVAGLFTARADSATLKTSTTGTPKISSIDVIRFGPDGLLLIGDGRGAQVFAVETGDTKPGAALKAAIEKIDEKLAEKLGAPGKGIEVIDLAVNPASGRAYIAVRRQDTKKSVIMTVDGDGKIGEFVAEDVKFARVALPAGAKTAISKVTDLAWTESRLVTAAQANEEFACKLFSVPVPLEHDSKGAVYSTETYHVSHRAWETRAPMSTLMPFEDGGKQYVVGSFACTPIVKYALDDLKPDARVKGISVIELGSGNRPLRMFSYDKGGKSYVLVNTHRFHHKQRPFGPSPYWTCRFERDLLRENEKINANAVLRLGKDSKPATERMTMIEAYHGVVRLDKLDAERALALREEEKGGFTLAPLPLP